MFFLENIESSLSIKIKFDLLQALNFPIIRINSSLYKYIFSRWEWVYDFIDNLWLSIEKKPALGDHNPLSFLGMTFSKNI